MMIRPSDLVTLLRRTVSCDELTLIRHDWATNRISATSWSVSMRQPALLTPTSAAVATGLIALLWRAPLLDPAVVPGAGNQILLVTGRRVPTDDINGEAVGWRINRARGFRADDVALVRTICSLFERPAIARTAGAPTRLTVTEVAILRLLAEGCSSAQIAERRGQSVRTVNKHIENIYRKIGCHDRVHATRYALRVGLTDNPAADHDSVPAPGWLTAASPGSPPHPRSD